MVSTLEGSPVKNSPGASTLAEAVCNLSQGDVVEINGALELEVVRPNPCSTPCQGPPVLLETLGGDCKYVLYADADCTPELCKVAGDCHELDQQVESVSVVDSA